MRIRDRRGVAIGDVLIGLALLVLLATLLYPTLRARRVEAGLAEAIAAVETLRTAALERHRATGVWPSAGGPGAAPPELAGALRPEQMRREGYTLEWTRWDVVDLVPAPAPPAPTADAPPDSVAPPMVPRIRQVGSVAVHSSDEALLAELLGRFSDRGAFVRDTTWMLVLTPPAS